MKIPENLLMLQKLAASGDDVATGYRDKMLEKFPDITIADIEEAIKAAEAPVESTNAQLLTIILSTLRVDGVDKKLIEELIESLREQGRYQHKLTHVLQVIDHVTSIESLRYMVKELAQAQAIQAQALQRLLMLEVAGLHMGELQRIFREVDYRG